MAKNHYWINIILLLCTCTGFAKPNSAGSSFNSRDKVKQTYSSQLGIRERTGRNDGKAVEAYLKYVGLTKGNPWCAAFVCWALGQNNIKNPKSGYCPDLFWATNTIYRRNKKSNLTPSVGDVFGIYFPEKGRVAHVGFIDSWGAASVVTVEGNTNDAGSREGDGVYRKIRLTRQIYAVAELIK